MNPTLREGDHEADGWVKYLQELLVNANHDLNVDGNFGPLTHKAVRDFQHDRHLLDDGVVGNQTWSALLGDAPQDIGTDGLQPHTHHEEGQRVVWNHNDVAPYYSSMDDTITMWAYNVGAGAVGAGTHAVQISVTDPLGQVHAAHALLDSADGQAMVQPGEPLSCVLKDVAKTYGRGLQTVQAFMPQDLGGSQMAAQVATDGPSPDEAGHSGQRLVWLTTQESAWDPDTAVLTLLAIGIGDVPVEDGVSSANVVVTDAAHHQNHTVAPLDGRIRLEDGTYSYTCVVHNLLLDLERGPATVHATLPPEVGGEQIELHVHL